MVSDADHPKKTGTPLKGGFDATEKNPKTQNQEDEEKQKGGGSTNWIEPPTLERKDELREVHPMASTVTRLHHDARQRRRRLRLLKRPRRIRTPNDAGTSDDHDESERPTMQERPTTTTNPNAQRVAGSRINHSGKTPPRVSRLRINALRESHGMFCHGSCVTCFVCLGYATKHLKHGIDGSVLAKPVSGNVVCTSLTQPCMH